MKTLDVGNEFGSFLGSLNTKKYKNNPAEQPQSLNISSARTWQYLFQWVPVVVIYIVSIVHKF